MTLLFLSMATSALLATDGSILTQEKNKNCEQLFIASDDSKTGLSYEEVNAQDQSGCSALHYAAEEDNLNKVKYLLACGADPDLKNKEGLSPFFIAVEKGSFHVAEAMLRAGVDVDATGLAQCTALHIATKCEHVALVGLLLLHHADRNAQDVWGETPLHYAVLNGNTTIARFIVRTTDNEFDSVDVNIVDAVGKTPLHYAAENDDEAMVRLLIEAGADTLIEDGFGKQPVHCAKKSEIIKILKEAMKHDALILRDG